MVVVSSLRSPQAAPFAGGLAQAEITTMNLTGENSDNGVSLLLRAALIRPTTSAAQSGYSLEEEIGV